jgi:hypothetical protein
MKHLIKTAVMCASLTALLTACSESSNKPQQTVSASKSMASDELISAGEQLITPTSLHLADRAFAMVLAKEPGNKKAQFYRALLKRPMVFRGIGTNIEPLIAKHGNANEYHEAIEKMPSSSFKSFLLIPKDGVVKSIKEEKDLQKLLIEYRKAAMDFRRFVAQNPDLSLELHISPKAFSENSETNCHETQSNESSLTASCDGTTDQSGTIKINTADLVVLKQEAAGEVLYATLYASYNMNGFIDASKEIEGKNLTSEQQVKILMDKVDLSLLDKEGMQAIHSLGADLVSSAKWVQKYQQTLCVRDENGLPTQRKQHLVSDSSLFCINNNEDFNKGVKMVETAFNGPISFAAEDGSITTVNLLAPFNKPVSNLKQLAPLKWSADGEEVISYKDPSFAGFFPM